MKVSNLASNFRATTIDETAAENAFSARPFGTFAPNIMQRGLIRIARNSILRRGLFRGTMTAGIMKLSGTPLDVMFRGCGFRLFGNQNLIEYGILLEPKYNAGDIDFLLEGSSTSSNFVDLGSNIGLYSLPCAKAAPQGITVSIDANPKMANLLNWNADASKLTNVRMISCAVSDSEGRGDLVIRKDDIAIVALVEKQDGAVPVRTLAAIIAQLGLTAIHGLKIDIEGHEDKALVPFLDSAPHDLLPKRIVIEHPEPEVDYPGCTAAFARHGYALVGRSRNNSFYRLGNG
jgi:FkbM family methyltransferase